jgi:4'-phosphopantetheinyl transferase
LFFFSKQQQFVVARSQLRTILGHYLNLAPQTLQFQYTPRGKPILASAYTPHYSFNLAHSQQSALIAIALHSQIGVDIEAIRPIRLEALAKRILQPTEVEWLFTLAPEQRQSGFFRLWTCKEAYLKATGEGLAGLQQVQVMWDADRPVLHTPSEQRLWSLQELTVEAGFVAALVVEGQPKTLQWFDALSEQPS